MHPLLSLIALATALPAFVPPDPAVRVTVTGDAWTVADGGCPVRPIDDGLRQRLVDVAAAEWARFGFPVTDYRERRGTTVVTPRGGPLIPPALNTPVQGIARASSRLGLMEDDADVRRAIGGYWTTVPGGDQILADQSAIFRIVRTAGWAEPWSAAFISYLECSAGVADVGQFVRSDGHFRYVDQAIATADGNAAGIYRAREVDSGLPAPGDLLCADRAPVEVPYRTIADRRGDESARNMHCDLVVKVQPGRDGYVALIGGNVVQAATLSLVNIVPARGGKPARVETAQDQPHARPWFAVLSLQAGGTARLEASPAIRGLR